MRTIWIVLIGVAVSSCAYAAQVTYTLSLNENVAGVCTPNRFSVYIGVSQGDNDGLFAFGVDLAARLEPNGSMISTPVTNRSPFGQFIIDTSDPNYDPDIAYPERPVGFSLVRAADSQRGTVSAAQDLGAQDALVLARGIGQRPGNLDDFYPEPFINPPSSAIAPGEPVAYKHINVPYGTPAPYLPDGTIRVMTGFWTGPVAPSFQTSSVDNKAGVWVLGTTTQQVEIPPIQYVTRDLCLLPEPGAALSFLAGSLLVFCRRRSHARL